MSNFYFEEESVGSTACNGIGIGIVGHRWAVQRGLKKTALKSHQTPNSQSPPHFEPHSLNPRFFTEPNNRRNCPYRRHSPPSPAVKDQGFAAVAADLLVSVPSLLPSGQPVQESAAKL
jgi:hypothetical protein